MGRQAEQAQVAEGPGQSAKNLLKHPFGLKPYNAFLLFHLLFTIRWALYAVVFGGGASA